MYCGNSVSSKYDEKLIQKSGNLQYMTNVYMFVHMFARGPCGLVMCYSGPDGSMKLDAHLFQVGLEAFCFK